jgi:hypothetical protein
MRGMTIRGKRLIATAGFGNTPTYTGKIIASQQKIE